MIAKILPPGLVGIFCAVILAAFISTHDTYLHSWGSILIQDVLIPIRGKPLTTKQHMLCLRLSIVGVAVFIFIFSIMFKQTEHILLFFMITGAIYMGGMGAAVVGGLYWKYATARGAWAAAIIGSTLALLGVIVPQFDENLLPFDSKWMTAISVAAAIGSYIVFSLVWDRKKFNLDKMLHRGQYAQDGNAEDLSVTGFKTLCITREYSWDDKVVYVIAIIKTFLLSGIFVVGTIVNVIQPSSSNTWLSFWRGYVIVYLVLAIIFTPWLLIGGINDLRKMYIKLKTSESDESDDGFVY